jgi:CubicO group peptidase (beta-lactamase class C family)
MGIDLAAYALQLVTGMPFHAYARQRLLEPLGLDRTTFDQRAISAERDRAIGHDSQVKRLPVWIPMVAAGGLHASVEDACRFVQFHLANGEDLLAPEHLATMYSVPFPEPQQDLGYGLGTAYLRWVGRVIRGQGGGGFGFSCNVVWSPEDAIGVVILTNGDAFQPSAEVPRRFFRESLGAASEQGVVGEGATPSFDGSFVGRGGSTPAGSDPGARFRVDGDYLVRNDGFTFYRNDVSEFPADARPDGVWNRGYVTTIAGTRVEQVRLLRAGDRTAIEFVDMGLRLALTRNHDLLYFCSMGEALDLSRTPITYGNVPLSIDRKQRR